MPVDSNQQLRLRNIKFSAFTYAHKASCSLSDPKTIKISAK